jgi:hypothetical protein
VSSRALSKGIVAGAIGGVVGTFAMNYAQRLWTRAAGSPTPYSAAGKHDSRDWQERIEHRNANEVAANALARRVSGAPLTRATLPFAAAGLHFAFGAVAGAIHGALSESRPPARSSGWRFGTTVWLLADEIAMPILGLSEPTIRRPLELHLQSLAAHLVFGAAAEGARVSIRRAL